MTIARTTPPTMLTTILGRDSEIDLVAGLLSQPSVRLVSIVGPGGVGKTRLAIAVIERLTCDRAEPIHFVPLSSVRDAAEVLPAIATALDIRGNDATILRQQVVARLHDMPSLLVLDNMEHVREAVPLVLDLLTQCPLLDILTTTRIALRIPGERQVPLAPLPTPTLEHDLDAPEDLAAIPSVALFLDRATCADPGFTLRAENRDDVAAICVALEGMPLAIELAAPWVRVMAPAALRQRLGNRLSLLAASTSHIPERHRTLRETLRWSYDLLDEREQRVLRRCAIFTGSWPLIAAEAVCSVGSGPHDPVAASELLHAIGTLVDHSLLFAVNEAANAPRFRMLETIREFGLEMLEASGELPAVRDALATWCVRYAETNAPHIFGPDQVRWLDTFGHERDTMRSGALAALEQDDAIAALRISWHLGRFWLVRGHHMADHAWLERALAMDNAISPDPRAHAWGLMALGNSWFERGELQRASEVYRDASAYAAGAGVAEVESGGQLNDAIVRLKLGDVPAAHASAARSLGINRARGRRASVGKDLVILADILATEGNPDAALPLLDEAMTINQELGDIRMIALTVNTAGIVAMARGDLATARCKLRHSLDLSRQTQERRGIATSLQRLGDLELRERQFPAARDAYFEAMLLRKEIGDRWAIFECGEGFSQAIAAEQPRRASRMRAIADRLRVLAGAPPNPAGTPSPDPGPLPADAALTDTLIHEARLALAGHDTTPTVSTLQPPVEVARPTGQRPTPQPLPPLSRREREVLALIVAGYQDREIAQTLFLSVRTVSWHLTNIFTKLDVNSRVAAAVLAIQEGLVEPAAHQ